MPLVSPSPSARAWSVAAALAVVSLGTMVLAGWAFGAPRMEAMFTGGSGVRPASAVLTILLGLGVLFPRVARPLGLVAFLVAVVTLIHYAIAPDLPVDPFLGEGYVDLRIAVRSAIGAALAGLALLIRHRGVGQGLAAASGFIGFLSLVAEAYNARFLPQSHIVPMPTGVSLLFLIWSFSFLTATSGHGIVADLLSLDSWGRTMRRMALVGLLAPALFGALCIFAADAGVFDARFAVALVVTATAYTFLITTTALTGRIRDHEAMYRTIVETTQEGICIVAADGRLTFVNDRLAKLLGCEPRELIGTAATDLVADGDRPLVAERAAIRAAERIATKGELRLVRRDGAELTVISAATAIRPPGSDAEALLVTLTDVTERVRATEALERAQEVLRERVAALEGSESGAQQEAIESLAQRLADANRELEMFSYSVSHDLRAPLRAVDGFARELQLQVGPHLDDRGRRYFQRILGAAERMGRLIDDLLALSRLTRAPMRREKVDVTAVAIEVAAEAKTSVVHVQPGLVACADPRLLRVVLVNVIGNAVKFSAREPEPRVEVFDAGDGVIAVRDNGIGFDMQYADKVFAPFQRLDVSAQFEGTGIGLALVQRIVHRHGGTIRAEAAPGRGATFYLSFGGTAA